MLISGARDLGEVSSVVSCLVPATNGFRTAMRVFREPEPSTSFRHLL